MEERDNDPAFQEETDPARARIVGEPFELGHQDVGDKRIHGSFAFKSYTLVSHVDVSKLIGLKFTAT